MSSLSNAAAPNKASPPPHVRCATCDHGTVATVGQSCAGCWEHERRDRAIRARRRRTAVIGRLADVGGSDPAEFVELFADIALQAQEAAHE